jgi:hypothetical protein
VTLVPGVLQTTHNDWNDAEWQFWIAAIPPLPSFAEWDSGTIPEVNGLDLLLANADTWPPAELL